MEFREGILPSGSRFLPGINALITHALIMEPSEPATTMEPAEPAAEAVQDSPSNELYVLCKGTPTVAALTEILTRDPELAEETAEDGKTAFVCWTKKLATRPP